MFGLAPRLLTATGGASITLPAFPTDWGVERYAGNPVIDVTNNPNETTEQYVPAPIRLPNGDIWVYVKGADSIYAWKSTDDGETFALQNSNNPVIEPGVGWDSGAAIEPAATYDPDTDTIHLYYKGRVGVDNSTMGWGHATAAGSTPTSFTKDPGNPILSAATVAATLGGPISDLAISDVVKIGSTFHFYGYVADNSRYKLIQTTGFDWDDPGSVEVIHTAANDNEVVQSPSVFRVDGWYAMLWSIGGPQPDPRWVRVAKSRNASDWDFSDTTNIISPTGTGWEEDETYTGSVLKDGIGPEPYLIGGKMLFYYSGLEDSEANSGLAYLNPS